MQTPLLLKSALAFSAAIISIMFSFLITAVSPATSVYAAASTTVADNSDSSGLVRIRAQSSFVDSDGRPNVIGTVRNSGTTPVQVTLGLNVSERISSGGSSSKTVHELTYGRIIWPLTESPFKFVVKSGIPVGEPFIMDVRQISSPYYDLLVLNYSNMAVGEERALVGTVKNTAPFDIYNVSVFASVHREDNGQIDTVRSNVIPVLRAGEEKTFTAEPDPAIKSDVFYYSCAGLDFDDPITTIDTGDGRFIAYDLRSLAQISSLRYENATDSIVFGVRHYNPNGGPLSLKLPQFSQNHTVTVIMDDAPYEEALVRSDGKTLYVDFFVPKGEHEVQIQGVRNVPDLHVALLPFVLAAGVIMALVISKRLRSLPSFGAHV